MFFIVTVAVVAVVIVLLYFANRRMSAIREMLRGVAVSAGWSDVRNMVTRHGVKGRWRSFRATLSYVVSQDGSPPDRLIATIEARSDVRLTVRRRFDGFMSNKRPALSAPPIVEVQAPAASAFWVRADEVSVAERLFADAAVAAAIENIIVARFDELQVNAKGLRFVRAADNYVALEKDRVPKFTMGLEPSRIGPLARELWKSVEAVVNKLPLR